MANSAVSLTLNIFHSTSHKLYLCRVKQVLIAAPISEKFKRHLVEKNYELIEQPAFNTDLAKGITGIVTSNKLLLNSIELKKYPNLQWIARLGSGMEIIDTDYCNERGIKYFNSPFGIANSVAEHMTGMLLGLLHKICRSDKEVQGGQWIREMNRGVELEGLTVGIIGYGNTGSALAKKLSVFTPGILVYDKFKSGFSNDYIKQVSLEDIQDKADIISFHVPLKMDTMHYYNDEFLANVKKKHILMNASRGAVADTKTILKGLVSGKITGACLDVLEEEKEIQELLTQKNNIVHRLMEHNVIITPHIAGYSHNAIEKMSNELLNQMEQIQ